MFFLNHCIQENQFDTRYMYEDALEFPHEEARIQIQRIKGPILLISADYDSIWPSNEACKRMKEYLTKYQFTHRVKHVSYKYGSHMLIPIDLGNEGNFRVEKEHPEECDESKEQAFHQAINWFNEMWDE
jgi:dienelactone hydrolase